MKVGTAIRTLKLFGSGKLPHPAYLIFFVTSKCVGRCRHCFYWESINKDEDVLSLEEIEKVARSMGDLLQVTFTGGEPFIRDDFPEIVEIFHRLNNTYHLGIATSGYMTDKVSEGVEKILSSCRGANLTVGLPIEGPPELNNYIRGREDFFERTTETLSQLKKMKASNPGLTLLVDITASGFNRGRLEETYKLVRDDLRPDHINLILTRGVPREEGAKELDPEEVRQVHELMEDDVRAGRVSGYSFFGKILHAKDVVLRRSALDIYKGGGYDLPCEAGRVAGVLLPEGDVYPCELWNEPAGNVREADYDMKKVWNSEKGRAIRREIVESECSCYHQCFLSNTIFWNVKSWPAILKELTRQL